MFTSSITIDNVPIIYGITGENLVVVYKSQLELFSIVCGGLCLGHF